MKRIGLDIDHVGLVGPDIGATVAAFRKLGFQVTDPVELMGTAADGTERSLGQQSAHFIFGSTYVELSEVTAPGPDHHLAAWLAGDHAIRILILRAADIAAAREHAVEAGQNPTPIGEASRRLQYADGATARFRWLALPPENYPEALCGYVQHMTPALVFWPVMNAHPNGATELTGMTLHTGDVDDAVRRYGLLGSAQAPEFLEIHPAEQDSSGFSTLHLRTRSLDQTAQTLHDAGQPFNRDAGSLTAQAPGVLLKFSE